jgi:hypothetical protein
MRKLHINEYDRPLYLCRGKTEQELLIYFSSDGDFLATAEIVNAVRDELDDNGHPVANITRVNQTIGSSELLCITFQTDGREIYDHLVNQLRLATKVRCWGTAVAQVKEYYLNDQHLNSEAFVQIESGRPAPNLVKLEREEVDVTREGQQYRFIVPEAYLSTPDIAAMLVVEDLGLFLYEDVVVYQQDVAEVDANDSDEPNASTADLTAEDVPDTVEEMLQFWLHSAPPEEI